MAFLQFLVGDQNKKEINRLEKIVVEINALESETEKCSNPELKKETQKLKDEIAEFQKTHQLPLGSLAELDRSEEHTSELQSLAYLVCRLLL